MSPRLSRRRLRLPRANRRLPREPSGSERSGSNSTPCACATTRGWSSRSPRSEFDLLKAFADHPKRALSRERLLDLADARDPEAFDRAIDVRINRIRKKVEPDPANPRYIRTVRGLGYIFRPEGD
jgi:DNA-binding response OmpR family regulator